MDFPKFQDIACMLAIRHFLKPVVCAYTPLQKQEMIDIWKDRYSEELLPLKSSNTSGPKNSKAQATNKK